MHSAPWPVERTWRMIATGLCFAAFGLGGVLIRLLVFPLLVMLVRDRLARVVAARRLIQLAMRALVELMCVTGVMRYRITGLARLQRRGLLILANHPTLIDTVLLMAFVPYADCIVKHALWRNPFTRGPVRAAGYISNARAAGLVEDCIGSLRAGSNLIIFPEGTRTPSSGHIRFKRGAANVAIRGGRAITPVLIHCTPATLGKGHKWWNVPPRPAHFRIDIGEDIAPHAIGIELDHPGVAARRLTHYLQHHFMKAR